MPPAGDYSGYEALLVDIQDGILTVTLSNPRKKNALTARASEELTTIWRDVWRDPQVRVIVLTGAGDSFCAGYDLSEAGEELERGDQSRALVRSMTASRAST